MHVWPPSCVMMGVIGSNLTIFKLEPTRHNMLQHVTTGWPNAHNMFLPTMLRYVGSTCCNCLAGAFRVHSFGVIWIRISDPRSLGSWCIKGTDKSALVTDSSVPLMHHDLSDLGSLILIQIIPKERTLRI